MKRNPKEEIMIEVQQTHLPLLAWRRQNGRYVLIHDDLPIGELFIDRQERGIAVYHGRRWVLDAEGIRENGLKKKRASFHFQRNGNLEEGKIRVGETLYRCLRDAHKIPPKVTITGAEGQPLLQFREEEENRGRIQIDHLPAAALPDFDLLTFAGMYLYLTASPDLKEVLTRPPAPPAQTEEGGGGGEPNAWPLWALGALAAGYVAWRLAFRKMAGPRAQASGPSV
jgi:hypothetical protein